MVYSARSIKNWDCDNEFAPGSWGPARPIQFGGLYGFWLRAMAAWGVLVGRYDALKWDLEAGEP